MGRPTSSHILFTEAISLLLIIQSTPVVAANTSTEYPTFAPASGVTKNQCLYQSSKGDIYLWSIGQKNSPRFSDKKATESSDTGLYTFDPCYAFSQGNCTNSFVCRNGTSIGLKGTQKFVVDDLTDGLLLEYKGRQTVGKDSGTTVVTLVCDPKATTDSLEVVGQFSHTFKMTLTSRCCCYGVCSADKLSFGSILCILFAIAVTVYLVGGMLYMRCLRGARGIEVIPNLSFWMELPGLIVDGVNFVATCGKISETTDEGPGTGPKGDYQSI